MSNMKQELKSENLPEVSGACGKWPLLVMIIFEKDGAMKSSWKAVLG